MGDLLLNWLNDDIQLSKRVTNFEEDFHNGYLFGELLSKYSQQLNFHQFVSKDDKASRVKNFSLLLQTFSALKVTFDSNIAMKIINKSFGVAKKLLYELKTQLQKTNSNAFSKVTKMTKTLSPLKKIQISKQKYDEVNRQHFIKQLNQLHPAQKQIIQDRLLKKFGDFQTKSIMNANLLNEKDNQAKLLLRSKFNEQQRQNLKKSEEFRKQWQADHLQKWAVNMNIRQNQVSKDQFHKNKVQEQRKMNKTMAEKNALKSMENDINEFQKRNNVKKMIDSSDEEQIKEQAPSLQKSASKLSDKFIRKRDLTIKRDKNEDLSKTKKGIQDEKSKHQRQKRRRKMIVQQNKRYQMIEISRRQRCIIATIQQTSKQQKQIQYEIWRAWQNKNIITQNKKVVVEKQKQKQETRAINDRFKKDELLKLYRQQHEKQLKQGLQVYKNLQSTNKVIKRKQTYLQCSKILESILDIAQDMYQRCQQLNVSEIDQNSFQFALNHFVDAKVTSQQKSHLDLKHYIQGTHEWNIPIVKEGEDVSNNPVEDNALPLKNVNNYYLGNILKTIYQNYYKEKENTSPASNDQLDSRIVICLLGLDYAGKLVVAQQIKQKFGFHIIQIDSLIKNRLQEYNMLLEKGLQISHQTQTLAQSCYQGLPIANQVILKLIEKQLKAYPKSILVDFPKNYEEAIEITKTLGNVQPHDFIGLNKLNKKIKQFSQLVKPTQVCLIKRQLKECGVDYVLLIDITVRNSLDRMLGRRWIDNKQLHISDQINNPTLLRCGQKASALILRNNYKNKNKDKIKQWFQFFGFRFSFQDQIITKSCWDQIDGNTSKSQLIKNTLTKIQQVVKIKNTKKEYTKKVTEQNQKKKKIQQQEEKRKADLKQKCVFSKQELIKNQLKIALEKVNLEKQFVDKMADLWNKVQHATTHSFYKAFQKLRDQEQSKNKYIYFLKKNYISLLTRQDHKFYLIKNFQINYNKFIFQNQDMLALQYTKEELHQRVDDLQNDLLSITDQKREDAISERNNIMSSGWLESQLQILYECFFVMIQTQLNRFASSQKIIVDFYCKKFMVNPRGYQPIAVQINPQSFTSLEAIKQNTFPRLDKMISEVLRIFNREEDIVDDKNKKGGKAPPPKKDDKKAAKKGGKDELEQKVQPTLEQIEMKKAVNTEKAIFRQRINKIKTFASRKLKNCFESVQKLYRDLEDLYVYTNKAETKSIFNMSKIFRKTIQKQRKIQNQVQIKAVQITETQLIRNFEIEKPIVLPARQILKDDHFSIANMHEIIKIFEAQSQGQFISTKRFLSLMIKFIQNNQLKGLLPSTWKTITIQKVESFVKLIDYKNQGYVLLIRILLFFVMSGYKLPHPDQIQQYNLDLSNYSSVKEISKEKFVHTEAWFDQYQDHKQNTRTFNRNIFLKQILFNLFKRQNEDALEIDKYIKMLNLSEYCAVNEIYKQKMEKQISYFQFAFH